MLFYLCSLMDYSRLNPPLLYVNEVNQDLVTYTWV